MCVYCLYLLRMHIYKKYKILYSAAWSVMNPLHFVLYFCIKYDPKHHQIFTQDSHILQTYVNLCFQYLVWLHFAAITADKADQPCTTSDRNYSPFLSTKPLVMFMGFLLLTPCFRSLQNISVGLWIRHWLGHSKALPLIQRVLMLECSVSFSINITLLI